MRKFFKWLLYSCIVLSLLAVSIIALAYWNRDHLLKRINERLSEGIQGDLHIEKIDFTFLHHFPRFSVTLHNVYLRSDHYAIYRQDIFAAKKIFLDIGLYPLLKKQIKIKSLTLDNAAIFLFQTSDGYSNLEIFQPIGDSSDSTENQNKEPFLLSLQKIQFRNVNFIYRDSIKNKYMHAQFIDTNNNIHHKDSLYTIEIEGDLHFSELIFNLHAGSFLSDKNAHVNLHLALDRKANKINILPSFIKLKKHKVDIAGMFELKKEGAYTLSFHADDVDVVESKTWLNEKLNRSLQRFSIDQPLDISVSLAGRSIQGYKPDVDILFNSKNCAFSYGPVDFSDLSFTGSFTNHLDSSKVKDNANSQVTISSFQGNMEDFPIQGSVSFSQLDDPTMDLSFTSKVGFAKLNNQIDTDRFRLKSGTFTSKIIYKGKLSEYLDNTRTRYEGKLYGKITASNASLYYAPKKMLLDKIHAIFEFNEKKFTVNDLTFNLKESPIQVKGSMENFIPFFIRPQNQGYIRLNVTSPHLDLTSLSTKKEHEKKSAIEGKKDRKKITDLLDVIYNTLEFNINVKADQLTYKKFEAKDFKGQVNLSNNTLKAHPISMTVAGGSMDLNFTLSRFFNPISPVAINATVRNADIKEFFHCFNNFNQKTILAENLSGRISTDIIFNADIDESYSVMVPTMRGNLDCTIQDGELKNFEPLENISNFLFKKRDFSDVQFAELNSNFSIEGTSMDISRMEIQSSVLSLFLQGRYSFTDSTSLSVQLPLSNLKKRHRDFVPENIGTYSKTGPSIFLHIYRNKDINNKLNIAYDPFKKWAKRS